MDNHFDPRIHGKPWIAPGIFPQQKMLKHVHDDSGLAVVVTKAEKFKNFKELYEINGTIENLSEIQGIRFDSGRGIDHYDRVLVHQLHLIEQSTNCSQHSGSTRHDEERYYNNAITLKQELIAQYPIAKVYLKPLIYDAADTSIDSLYIQRRIGAFEVQACSKSKGETRKGTVFSKLESKQWPDPAAVINNVVQYLATSKLDIYVMFAEGTEGDLNNIAVTLTPYRQGGGRAASRQSGQNTMMTDPNKRPQSSLSRQSAQSKRSNRSKQAERRYVEKTDKQGVIRLAALPIDVYEVQVSESNDYQAESFMLNMFEMSESNQEMAVIVKLRKQPYAYLEIKVINNYDGFISDAKIEVFNTEGMQSTLAKPSGAVYELLVDPGRYILQITKPGIKDHKEEITALQGFNRISCEVQKCAIQPNSPDDGRPPPAKPPASAQPLRPLNEAPLKQQQQAPPPQQQQQQQQPSRTQSGRPTSAARSLGQQASTQKLEDLNKPENKKEQLVEIKEQTQEPVRPISGLKTTLVFIYDPYTNQPIPNVSVKLNEDSTKKTTTYSTDEDGNCKLVLQNILEGKLVIESEGYFPIVEEYGTSQAKMNLYQLRELSFPLIKKPSDQNSVQILIQTNVELMPIDVKLISPENLLINDNDTCVQYDYNEDSGCLKVSIDSINLKRGVYRIFADILEPEYIHPQTLKLYVITHKELKLVDVPKSCSEDCKYWDIGVVCAPNITFLEINTPTTQEISRDRYLKDYQELLNFLKNSKNMDLKTILGFNDKEKLEVSGDIFVQKEKIRSSLDKYGFESMKNLDYLIASAVMPTGLYSFKRLESKFNHLDFEFIFDDEKSTSKQKDEEGEDEPYDEDYDL